MEPPAYAAVDVTAPSPCEQDPTASRPPCPVMWYRQQGNLMAIPLGLLQMRIELHISTAFVDCTATWINTSGQKV